MIRRFFAFLADLFRPRPPDRCDICDRAIARGEDVCDDCWGMRQQ